MTNDAIETVLSVTDVAGTAAGAGALIWLLIFGTMLTTYVVAYIAYRTTGDTHGEACEAAGGSRDGDWGHLQADEQEWNGDELSEGDSGAADSDYEPDEDDEGDADW